MKLNIISFLAALFEEQLACQVAYLKCENQILRSRIQGRRIVPSREERALLLAHGKRLGDNLKDVITIIRYDTFQRWLRVENNPDYQNRIPKKRGPKRKAPEIRKLVVEMAENNFWGLTRLYGELRKLRIRTFSRGTIRNILKENNIPEMGKRTEPWINVIKRHHETLVACDFFKQWIWTLQGPRRAYVLFFINLCTRKVQVAGITRYPKANWVLEQTKQVFKEKSFQACGKAMLIRDRDTKFNEAFDDYLKSQGFNIFKTPKLAPNMNAFAESWIGKIRGECLNYFLIFGLKHLKYLIEQYVEYYNTKRPHMNMGFMPLEKINGKKKGRIRASPVLGGLHHDYYWE